MSKELYERLLKTIAEVTEEIQALPDSTANGQLIDAAAHAQNCAKHLERYFTIKGEKP